MKIAFAGKGGVGKTTLVAAMVRLLSEDSKRVLAIDADPNSNLALGFSGAGEIKPIVEMKDLIYERMEIKSEDPRGSFYKLNPKIDDIPAKFMKTRGNINLIVMGTVDAGGSGCVCPESTFLRELLKKLVLAEGEDIVMDMEAGIEHLGRSTAVSMDALLVVVEPSVISIETAMRVEKLAKDLKMRIYFIGNKAKDKKDEEFLIKNIGREAFIGAVSYFDGMRQLDRGGSIMDLAKDSKIIQDIKVIKEKLSKMEIRDESRPSITKGRDMNKGRAG